MGKDRDRPTTFYCCRCKRLTAHGEMERLSGARVAPPAVAVASRCLECGAAGQYAVSERMANPAGPDLQRGMAVARRFMQENREWLRKMANQ